MAGYSSGSDVSDWKEVTMKRIGNLLHLVGLTALAACGGGSSGDGGGGGDFEFPTGYDARLDASRQLNEAANATAPTAAMPATGSASYNGYAALGGTDGTGTEVDLLGNARLTANFAAGTFGGTVDGFQGRHGSAAVGDYSGSLAVTGGNIGGIVANGAEAGMAGTLTRDGTAITVDAGLFGQFNGDNAKYLVLGLGGASTVQIDGGAAGSLGGTIDTTR